MSHIAKSDAFGDYTPDSVRVWAKIVARQEIRDRMFFPLLAQYLPLYLFLSEMFIEDACIPIKEIEGLGHSEYIHRLRHFHASENAAQIGKVAAIGSFRDTL